MYLHERLSWKNRLGKPDLNGLELVHVSVGKLLQDESSGDAVAAKAVKDGGGEASQGGESWVNVERVHVPTQPVEGSLENKTPQC